MDSNQPVIPIEEQFQIMADNAPVLIWIAGIDKLCYFFNAGWLRFTGRTSEQEYGNGWTEGIHPDDIKLCLDVYFASFDARKEFKMEYRLKRHDGKYCWLLDNGVPRYTADGTFAGYIGSCMVIDELVESDALKKYFINTTALEKEQALNEELATANEELASSNEELASINEELHQTQENLQDLNNELEEKVKLRTRALSESEAAASAFNDELIATVKELSLSRQQLLVNIENLRNTVRQAPVGMCIVQGQPLFVVEANDVFLEIIGKERKQFNDKPYWVVNAEAAPYYEPITDSVMATGETYRADEHEIMLIRNGKEEIVHVDFVYEPIKDIKGYVEAIMIVAIEVTEKVNARKAIEQASTELADSNEELAAANEEMTATNEELAAVNEEMAATNEELIETQVHLQKSIIELAESESRFRSLVQQAPVAIFILHGRQLVIEAMNALMLQMLGKGVEVIGKTYADAMPEFVGQPFFKLLDDVFTSGEPYYGNEIKASIAFNSKLTDGYYNFIYQPIKDDNGNTMSIMCVCIDVTSQVSSRKEVERAEESLRMAVDAAELGSYYINVIDRIFVASPRLKEFFGFGPDEEVPYEAAINQIHPDYRQAAADLVEAAITKGVRFDMEYPIIQHNDGKIRWVRGIGTVQQDNDGVNRYFTGVLHDITERRQDDMRKNDFIGMVSHELKTPLTSLTAIIQVLNAKLKNTDDKFVPGALEKANMQVKKMTTMINGFLNISRLESSKIVIDKQRFNLEDLVEETIKEAEITVSSHTINFEPCNPVMIDADHDKIGSVISNLISNAVKYSPKGKVIDVKCEVIDGTARISIKDEGMGIKQEDIPNLFERYYRVQNSHTQHISGFGIGLYLSSEIIHRHDGKIWVESESGKGSTFYFSLPLSYDQGI